jgi:hypothetical protein
MVNMDEPCPQFTTWLVKCQYLFDLTLLTFLAEASKRNNASDYAENRILGGQNEDIAHEPPGICPCTTLVLCLSVYCTPHTCTTGLASSANSSRTYSRSLFRS